MAFAEQDVIEREIQIAAKPEAVFQFFVEPQKMTQWKGIQAIMDARVGGNYQIIITAENIVSGSFVEIEAPHRIVFTWGWEGDNSPLPPGATTVEVTFASTINNGTLLRLRHYGLPPPLYKMHVDGWDYYLPRLINAVEQNT